LRRELINALGDERQSEQLTGDFDDLVGTELVAPILPEMSGETPSVPVGRLRCRDDRPLLDLLRMKLALRFPEARSQLAVGDEGAGVAEWAARSLRLRRLRRGLSLLVLADHLGRGRHRALLDQLVLHIRSRRGTGASRLGSTTSGCV